MRDLSIRRGAGHCDRAMRHRSFALVWALLIAIGLFVLWHTRITIPLALTPVIFVTRPMADVFPLWLAVAIAGLTWIGGLMLYEDGR